MHEDGKDNFTDDNEYDGIDNDIDYESGDDGMIMIMMNMMIKMMMMLKIVPI